MIPIKFKAWDLCEKRMISPEEFNDMFSYAESASLDFWLNNKYVIPLQYTGFNDKNNVELYDGDICIFDVLNTLEHYPDLNPIESYYIFIESKYCSWGFRYLWPKLVHEDDREFRSFWDSEDKELISSNYFRKIGDIFNNTELLIQN